jgi:hypothetical protein
MRSSAHIQWCATALRRCLSLVPPSGLQIDIFVTNLKTLEHERKNPAPEVKRISAIMDSAYAPVALDDDNPLLPPAPRYSRHGSDSRSSSVMSLNSANSSVESFVDLNPITEEYGDEDLQNVDVGAPANFTIDLTNFEGDDDAALPGEDQFSNKVRKRGKILREKTRKAKKALAAKEQRERTAQTEGHQMALSDPDRSRRHSTDMSSPRSRPVSARFDADPRPSPLSSAMPTSLSPTQPAALSPPMRSSSPLPSSGRSRPSSISDPPVGFDSMGRKRMAAPSQFSPTTPPATGHSRPASISEISGGAPDSMGHRRIRSSSPFRPDSPSGFYDAGHRVSGSDWDVESGHNLVSKSEYPPYDGLKLEVEDNELEDVNVVSECARPGKPKMERIFADEVENSEGSVIVGCQWSSVQFCVLC